ncbi:hypothetical protein K8S19_10070 [bacterium]|nr:hypothetical protein [bacterium]
MPNTKGTDVVTLKKILKNRGEETYRDFLKKLDEETTEAFLKIITTTWTPIHLQAKIYEVAAATLFPGHNRGILQLHRELAKSSYSSIYKIFLRIPTIPFIARRAAAVWRSYYDTGNASVENIENKSLDFIVRAFPQLPFTLREAANAHIAVLVEATGAKNVRVVHHDSDPQQWTWKITWE